MSSRGSGGLPSSCSVDGSGRTSSVFTGYRAQMQSFVDMLELGTPGAGKMLTVLTVRRLRFQPHRLLALYLSSY